MTFCLNSIILEPEKQKIESAIILLHGYGGDGKDISVLSLNWKRHLPNTVFICPDGYEKCQINPAGFQWFDLNTEDLKTIIEGSKRAEKKLFDFIKEVKEKYDLKNSQICICGFSQGCMISINLGLTSTKPFNCIVGFSGKIIDKSDIQKRIISKTKFLLIHGNDDDVVSPTNLLEAKDFLLRNNIETTSHMIKDCGHHISVESSSLALNFIKKNLHNY
ncbi:MAG: serine esterase [Candidatus Pelagibacter sp. TMED166]|nr:MAG: serine esterase [Candidatus Pelagibacter sp. TMED166]